MKKILLIIASLLLLSFGAHAQTDARAAKKNLVVKEWNTDARTNTRVMDHVTTYNADGRKIEEIEYYSNGKQKWRKRYEYGPNGKVSRELVYDEKNKLDTAKKYEYNELDQKKTQYNYDAKGKLKSVKVFEYIAENA